MSPDPRASLGLRLIAVINIGSGSTGAASATRMAAIFTEAGFDRAEIFSVRPKAIEKALRDAAAVADVVVVLGGDGTIRSAAEICGRAGKPLIPLPGGTMNMLPRALYGDVSWEIALRRTLDAPVIRGVSGGMAEGQSFFCAAILGSPSLWADAREAMRRGRLVQALKRAYLALRRRERGLHYQIGEDLSGHAEGVAVICPLVSRALAGHEPALEAVALAPMTAGAMFRLAFHAIFDDWRLDPSMVLAKVQTVRVSGPGRVPVILDGEKAYLGRAVTVVFQPLAFQAIVPAINAPQEGS
jgi:diacylglycerol kinase family enzyme